MKLTHFPFKSNLLAGSIALLAACCLLLAIQLLIIPQKRLSK